MEWVIEIDQPIDWLIDQPIDWLIGWLIGALVDWLIDWLINDCQVSIRLTIFLFYCRSLKRPILASAKFSV